MCDRRREERDHDERRPRDAGQQHEGVRVDRDGDDERDTHRRQPEVVLVPRDVVAPDDAEVHLVLVEARRRLDRARPLVEHDEAGVVEAGQMRLLERGVHPLPLGGGHRRLGFVVFPRRHLLRQRADLDPLRSRQHLQRIPPSPVREYLEEFVLRGSLVSRLAVPSGVCLPIREARTHVDTTDSQSGISLLEPTGQFAELIIPPPENRTQYLGFVAALDGFQARLERRTSSSSPAIGRSGSRIQSGWGLSCEVTMDRRKFIIGVGALGAGTSAALGTGAFTSVEANRSFEVATAGDAGAYLRLEAVPGSANAGYVSTEDGTLSVTLDEPTGTP
ncbi:hypothetical protein ACFQRB_19770 [Halobaculum litoreum]|uniref:Uncharacterized protein n=1 Tax=Halobaculum litoreum TaxID=3031998 RepID=A0ABD5XSI8_9EURY